MRVRVRISDKGKFLPVANKYSNERTTVDEIKFSSKKEAARYRELKLMERAKVVKDLKCQVPFEIVPKQQGERAAHYVADFTYWELQALPPEEQRLRPAARGVWTFVVEDVKGYRTSEYVLKRKLMLLVHQIRITET